METIWLNLGMAAIWAIFGVQYAPWLTPISILVFIYSFAHDWHEEASIYREIVEGWDDD